VIKLQFSFRPIRIFIYDYLVRYSLKNRKRPCARARVCVCVCVRCILNSRKMTSRISQLYLSKIHHFNLFAACVRRLIHPPAACSLFSGRVQLRLSSKRITLTNTLAITIRSHCVTFARSSCTPQLHNPFMLLEVVPSHRGRSYRSRDEADK